MKGFQSDNQYLELATLLSSQWNDCKMSVISILRILIGLLRVLEPVILAPCG